MCWCEDMNNVILSFFCEKKKSILTEHSKFCENTSLHKQLQKEG